MKIRDQKQSDIYIRQIFGTENDAQLCARKSAFKINKNQISITQNEGQVLKFLVQTAGCKKFIEVGTLTGLSACYILEGLSPGGLLWTLELNQEHVNLAKETFSKLNLNEKKIIQVIGDAQIKLEELAEKGPFDGIFIDGNKSAYLSYLDWSEKNIRKGGLIVADNVYLHGAIWGEKDTPFSEKQIEVMTKFNQRLANKEKYESVIMPTSDGMFAAIKKF